MIEIKPDQNVSSNSPELSKETPYLLVILQHKL